MGKLSELMNNQPILTNYNDPGNPIVTVYINENLITNTLIDLGETINVMNKELFTILGIHRLRHMPTC